MSIIQEALKKAERNIKDPKKAPASPQGPSPSSPDQSFVKASGPAAGRDPKAVAILLVALIATAVFAASQLFPKKNIPVKSSVADAPAVVTSKDEGFPALPSVIFQQPAQQQEEKKPASPEFILNGIMYLEGNPRAIINDIMAEAGDMVDGARVVKIEKKGVLLHYNDIEIYLELK